MTRHVILSLSAIALATLAGCTAKPTSPKVEAAAPIVPQGPVIVRLVGQHQEVTVTSGPDGPLYTAKADGRTVVANATLEQLHAEHPEVYRFVEPGVATVRGEEVRMITGSVEGSSPRQLRSAGGSSDRFLHSGR